MGTSGQCYGYIRTMGTSHIRSPFIKRDFQRFPTSAEHREHRYSKKDGEQIVTTVVTMDKSTVV